MGTGGILAAVSFFVSGGLELQLETTYVDLPPPGQMLIHSFNGINMSCSWPTVDVKYGGPNGSPATQLKMDDPFFASAFFEKKDGEFYIPSFKIKCTEGTVTFEEIYFKGPPKEKPVSPKIALINIEFISFLF